MTDDPRDRVLACADALVAAIEGALPCRTSPAERYAEIYASAGLARGADLLGAALACLRAGRRDAVGVLVRSIVDTWLVALYLYKGGLSALASLEYEYQRNQQVLAQRNGATEVDPLLEDRQRDLRAAAADAGLLRGGDRFSRLTVERIASELADLPVDNLDAVQRYELLYRSYSTFDAHGLGPIERRIDTSNLEAIALQEAAPWIDPCSSIGVAALVLGEFAIDVMQTLGIDTGDVSATHTELESVMEVLAVPGLHVGDRRLMGGRPPMAEWRRRWL